MELISRFDGWEAGDFEFLLIRAEEQNHQRNEVRKKRIAGGDSRRAKAQRVKDLAQHGAYSKAVFSLTSEMARFTPTEELYWSENLWPRSERTEEAFVGAAAVDL